MTKDNYDSISHALLQEKAKNHEKDRQIEELKKKVCSLYLQLITTRVNPLASSVGWSTLKHSRITIRQWVKFYRK